MKIVLSGVETNNKGAELMLYAILQEIERRYPKAFVYVEPGTIPQGLRYIETKLALKEKPIVAFRKWCTRLHLGWLMYRLFGNDVFDDVHAVKGTNYFFNDSGFYYTDKWNLPKTMIESRRKLLAANYKIGAKIIFLPQAIGPVTQDNVRAGLEDLQKYASVVMPREKKSLDYLVNTHIVDENKIMQFPDFTAVVKGRIPAGFQCLHGGVCLIPNVRMLDKCDVSYEDYLKFFQSIVDFCEQKGFVPYLLNHEGKDDGRLAKRLQKDLKHDIVVVDELNALEVKGLISTAYLVISSRFHGVASSLNSCVPCLSTSWGHKYEELFNSYNQTDCVLGVHDISRNLQKVSSMLDKHINSSIRNYLSSVRSMQISQIEEMWRYIWNLR